MTDPIKFNFNEYKNVFPILIPAFLFLVYFNWKFDLELFILNELNIFNGFLLIILCLYLGIFFQVIAMKLINFETLIDVNTSFSFYCTSFMVFFTIFIIEIIILINNVIDNLFNINVVETLIIFIEPFNLIIIAIVMLMFMKYLTEIHGNKS